MESRGSTIPCKVSLGMFSNERGVRIELPNGNKISALVDREQVEIKQEPKPGKEVDGRVRVYVVEQKNDLAIVDLPQPGFSTGTRLQVPKRYLE